MKYGHLFLNKRWTWLGLCRRTRQIVGYHIGDRTWESCLEFWYKIPKDYRKCSSVSDLWDAYDLIFGENGKHRSCNKKSGELNHIERFNNTLRQRLSRYTRKTLSFSKSDEYHNIVTARFIQNYNLSVNM